MTDVMLVGSGPMAQDYARVLMGQGVPFVTIGRGEGSAVAFEAATGTRVVRGGLATYLASGAAVPRAAIVAVGVDQLAATTTTLLAHGARRLLVEKPAGLNVAEISALETAARGCNAEVFVAYNRRFYAATLEAQRLIAEDGGVTSFAFEFTEWAHTIAPLPISAVVKSHWFLANSTHVVDLAFFLGGTPQSLAPFVAGALEWHPAGAVFAGAGVTTGGALFSYQANWAAPGRWGVEVLTRARRFIFRPMEQLHVQVIGSVAVNRVPLDDALDTSYKPGLHRQIAAFLAPGPAHPNLLGLADHREHVEHWYARILTGH